MLATFIRRTDEMKKKNSNYISFKESREIIKSNRAEIKRLEKLKKRKNIPEEEYVTRMRDDNNVVEFDDLHTFFFTDSGVVKAVDGVSFDIPAHSTVGVVGESGCGKSVTSLSLMQLVQGPQGQVVSGSMRYKMKNGVCYDIAKLPSREMEKISGKEIAMIFQEPMTSLNPVFTIGYQLDEVTLLHVEGATRQIAKQKSLEMLELVGIANKEGVYKSYPHELSGGMRQRVMIAMALCCQPNLIIADEPTTALDVTIQAQILDLLRNLKNKFDSSIMLITHDLGVIAEMADYVVVMYAGRIIEAGSVYEIFDNPSHPYTIGLLRSKPVINKKVDELYSIKGRVPNAVNLPNYCYFKDRCDMCTKKCDGEYPQFVQLSPTHKVACYRFDPQEIEARRAAEEAAAKEAAKAEEETAATAENKTEAGVPAKKTASKTTGARTKTATKKTGGGTSKAAEVNTSGTAEEKTASKSSGGTTKKAGGGTAKKTGSKTAGETSKTAAAKAAGGTSKTAAAKTAGGTSKTAVAKTAGGTSKTAVAKAAGGTSKKQSGTSGGAAKRDKTQRE